MPKTRPATNHLPEFPPLNPAELEALSREAGRKLSTEDAHRFRRDKIKKQEADYFVYGKRQS